MNTVKHLKSSSSPPWRKTHSLSWSKKLLEYIPAVMFGMLVGTYLDLFLVGNQLYFFPERVLGDIFSINIAFTLLGLPLMLVFFLYVSQKLNEMWKAAFILILSLLMTLFEKMAEEWGLFIHSPQWEHVYTFFGYIVYLSITLSIHHWTSQQIKS